MRSGLDRGKTFSVYSFWHLLPVKYEICGILFLCLFYGLPLCLPFDLSGLLTPDSESLGEMKGPILLIIYCILSQLLHVFSMTFDTMSMTLNTWIDVLMPKTSAKLVIRMLAYNQIMKCNTCMLMFNLFLILWHYLFCFIRCWHRTEWLNCVSLNLHIDMQIQYNSTVFNAPNVIFFSPGCCCCISHHNNFFFVFITCHVQLHRSHWFD